MKQILFACVFTVFMLPAQAGGWTFEVAARNLAYPEGLCFAAAENTRYFAEWSGDSVGVLHGGHIEQAFSFPSGSGPCGIAEDESGHLWICLYNGLRVVKTDRKGKALRIIWNGNGQPFRGPNDLVCDGGGGIYFTDSGDFEEDWRSGRPAGSIWHAASSGKIRKAAEALCYPNGIALSRDRSMLLVNEHRKNRVMAFDIAAAGVLKNRRVFAELNPESPLPPDQHYELGPDGICPDGAGGFWIAQYGGGRLIHLSGKGDLIEEAALPAGNRPTSICPGPDPGVFFVTESGTGRICLMKRKEG
jgi:gluconolactonase